MMSLLTPQRLTTLVVLLAVLGGCWLVASRLRGDTPAESASLAQVAEAEIPITTATVTSRVAERFLDMVGTLEGHDEVTISAKVEGRITRLYHDVGDVVHPGDILAEIDDTDYRLNEREAQHGLELELARLGVEELPGDGKLDPRKVPAVMRAMSLESNARQVLDRARRLGASRVIGTEEMEKVSTDHRVALSTREHAEMEVRTVLATARLKKAQLDAARQKITDTKVLVPCPSLSRMPLGCKNPKALRYVVAARKVSEGEMVRSGSSALYRLVIDRPLKLIATLPERLISEVRREQPVTLRVEAYPDRTFPATVARINPTVDRINRTFTIEVHVPNVEGDLPAGGFVKARLRTRRNDQALTVPEEAIVRFAGVVKVFVVQDNKVFSVPVRTGEPLTVRDGETSQRWVEVRGKLTPGATVVTSGQSMLADGSAVRIRSR